MVSRFGVMLLKGHNTLETGIKVDAATLTIWDAEKDEKLLYCMACGDAEEQKGAFDAFYRRHAPYFYGICYDLLSWHKVGLCEIDDLFQTTMLKAWQHADTFDINKFITEPGDSEHAADAWLGGIAENIVLDWLRRRPACVPLDLESLESEGVCLARDESSAEEDSEEIQLIRKAIDTLSPIEQKVVWATNQFYKRRKHQRIPTKDLDEIVASLQISRENLRKIRERAWKKIRAYVTNPKIRAVKK